MSNYKSTDALMRHLRNNGIAISGSSQKQQLINTGYFHGYKGYRFFVSSNRRIPFTSYNEINATIQYDTKLKSLLYGKMMLIETALKNIALNTIMAEIDSNSIYDMYDKALNEIYALLKEQLSSETMQNLQSEQIKWIEKKEATATNEAEKYKGGSFEFVAYNSSLYGTTKNRCYELVNNYMTD